MTTLLLQHEPVAIHFPLWVNDLASFRRWATSDDFPTSGWYAYLAGTLWVDLTMERLAHNKLKTKICSALTALVEEAESGEVLGDRMLLTHVNAELSTEPDGMFLSHDSLDAGRVRTARGADSLEVEGSPDMVLEVVSPTSVHKDTVVLRDLYWRAGIPEYWIADPRHDDVTLELLRRGAKGYVASRKQRDGWVKSAIFGKSFRLTGRPNRRGYPTYTLAVR